MIIKVEKVNERPYCFIGYINDTSVALSSISIKLDAADSHGTLVLLAWNTKMEFRFSKWEYENNIMTFYVGIDYDKDIKKA